MRATHTGGGKNKSVPKPHNGWVNIYTKKFTQVIGRHANTHTRIPHRKHVHSARKNCNNKLSATVEVRTPRFVPHSHAGVPVFDADTCVPALQVPRRNTPWGFLQGLMNQSLAASWCSMKSNIKSCTSIQCVNERVPDTRAGTETQIVVRRETGNFQVPINLEL